MKPSGVSYILSNEIKEADKIIEELLKNETEDIPIEKEDVKEIKSEISPEEQYIKDYDNKLMETMGWTNKDEVETY